MVNNKKQNTESMEKYFFAYILENPRFFNRVEPVNFKNTEIRYVYQHIRDYFLAQKTPIVPSNQKIFELIRLYDIDGEIISKEYLKGLLSVNTGDMIQSPTDDFLTKSLYAWNTSNTMRTDIFKVVDMIRDSDTVDYENIVELAGKVREIAMSATMMNYDDNQLGLSFFDYESHLQDNEANKIPTGWEQMDDLMNGGWDRKTLNMIIGPSNSGKSVWLCNIAANALNVGKNVVYITLEMSDKKVMKRIGSALLKIPIDEYDTKSRDKKYMNQKLKDFRAKNAMFDNENLFDTKSGQLFVKEFASGTCQVSDIDNYIKHLEETKNINVDVVVVDYLTIMASESGSQSTLFSNGKYLSNGLRAIAQTRNLCMITAMQVGKDNYGSTDINLTDISESKAIIENADLIYGIIRTDAMRAENKYILKLLKIRDGGFKFTKIHFDMNPKFLSVEKDKRMD